MKREPHEVHVACIGAMKQAACGNLREWETKWEENRSREWYEDSILERHETFWNFSQFPHIRSTSLHSCARGGFAVARWGGYLLSDDQDGVSYLGFGRMTFL